LKAVAVKALALGAAAGSASRSGSSRGRGGFGGIFRGRREAGDLNQVEVEEEAAFALLVRTPSFKVKMVQKEVFVLLH
jgi:hypothetical protein